MRVECFKMIDHLHGEGWLEAISLTFEERSRSRGKACTKSGTEIAWFLDRGVSLRHGNALQAADGALYLVEAAPEPVSVVTSEKPGLLMRVAYHLGNRHLSLQVTADRLLYQSDHVLDDMVTGLGATVSHELHAFQPEDGAYHSHGAHGLHHE